MFEGRFSDESLCLMCHWVSSQLSHKISENASKYIAKIFGAKYCDTERNHKPLLCDREYLYVQIRLVSVSFYSTTQSAVLLRHVVRLFATLKYRGHTGWNISKIVQCVISLGFLLSADPNITDLLQRGHPKFWPE